ncbi:KaiC domain-containing protein [Halorhabdus rudnickae]|uniref:KaiC domain-containing protein n=1 Tax=Halorhabdus rudnickae TaxID=1775544 RepID=UPI001083E28C|nr:KaiC domain-containing protein [Halorhabdus rudnickae]
MSEDEADEDWFERALADEADEEVDPSELTNDADWFSEGEDSSASERSETAGEDELGPHAEATDSVSTTGESDAMAPGDDEAADTTGAMDAETTDAAASVGAGGIDVADEGADDSLFEEDFASALASAGGPEGGEDAETGGFDDEDFDSEIPRINLGIEGLDEMIQGGIPSRHLMVVIGAPGTGKTTFGLQFLNHGLQSGENAVFVTLEQSRESIIDTANERGWEFDRYEREDRLAIVDLDPVEMANSLENIRGEFPELVREFGADRLVLDSVSLLEMMYDDQSRRRTEVFDFTRSLKAAGVTTMVTSEASEDNPYASRHGIIEYLTDAVFVLQYVRGDTQETRLAVEIQKIRNANHSRQTKPYAITLDGIDVYQQASIF